MHSLTNNTAQIKGGLIFEQSATMATMETTQGALKGAKVMGGMRKAANEQRIVRDRQRRRIQRLNNSGQHQGNNDIDKWDTGRIVEAWGNNMPTDTELCRLVYNNCNGISSMHNFAKCHEIGDSANEINASILGLLETCVDWSISEAKNTCKRILTNHFGAIKTNQSSSNRTFGSTYLPGGTLTTVRGKWAGRTSAEGNDDGMGRWSEVKIIGTNNRAVRVITAYRVCASQSVENSTGVKTAFMQQWHFLKAKNITNPDPRKQFLFDLQARSDNKNESLVNSRGSLSKWVQALGLVDVIAQRHGTDNKPETYSRGSERIDHIFMTPLIAEYVARTGILGYNELTMSDHRPFYADIDMAAFLGGEPSSLENGAARGITSNDPRAVKVYCEKLTKCMEETPLEEDLGKLLKSIEENAGVMNERMSMEADRLEEKFSAMKEASEHACRKIKSYQWSPKLRDARKRLRY
jgi:hypothetical protein